MIQNETLIKERKKGMREKGAFGMLLEWC